MERWTGILKVFLDPRRGGSFLNVTASLVLSSHSGTLMVPSANAIFFHGDRVIGTGNPVIERLSDSRNIAEILISKLGPSANVWVIEASTFNGPFAVYKEFIPWVNSRGEPQHYDPNGFPASCSIAALLSKCIEEITTISSRQVQKLTANNVSEHIRLNTDISTLFPTNPFPKTIILGFSKGGIVVNQLITELGHSSVSPEPCHGRQNHLYPVSKDHFLLSISEFHYVDVGLNCTGAYLTDPRVIKKIADHILFRNARIHFAFHGTPRQWLDHNRSWIRKEKDLLVELLKGEAHRCEDKLRVTEKFYFADKPPNMQMHFEILEVMNLG